MKKRGLAAANANEHQHDSSLAGFYATRKIPIVNEDCTIGQATEFIRRKVDHFDELDYIYIVKGRELVGVLSIRNLFSHRPDVRIKNILGGMSLVTIQSRQKAIQAAYLALKHKISSVPVTNEKGHIVGIITKEQILSILHRHHIEDRFIRAGIHRKHAHFDDSMETPVLKSLKFRLLWLLIGLAGGLVAAEIVSSFEMTLEKNIILASFLPLVVYIGDAVGTQLEAFSVRDFAIYSRFKFFRYFLRQCFIVAMLSLILGAGSAVLCLILYGSASISVIVGISVSFAVLSSVMTGLLIPFALKTLKEDPASGSGPVGTILQDILSVLIYFTVAAMML